MIISRHTHAVEMERCQIFSYFANHVIEVSLIVVHVKCIIGELELIAVKKTQPKSQQILQANVLELQRKEQGAKTKQPIQMVDAIYIKFYKTH